MANISPPLKSHTIKIGQKYQTITCNDPYLKKGTIIWIKSHALAHLWTITSNASLKKLDFAQNLYISTDEIKSGKFQLLSKHQIK